MPLTIQLLSDLHLESEPGRCFTAAPGIDLLVLAGDIGSYQAGSALIGRDEDFGLAQFSPRRPGSPWPRVLYVPGNHEYDALPFLATRQRLRERCERLGIEWLDREVRTIDAVRFVGCTLWSDFDALASPEARRLRDQGLAGGALSGRLSGKTLRRRQREDRAAAGEPGADLETTRRLRERDKALRAANFYLARNTTLRDSDGSPMLAEQIRELGLADQAWLRAALDPPHDGPTVVVTHFVPSLHCADPRYGITPGTAGFCNALDDLLPRAALWLHGHLHCPIDLQRQGCRILANPLGYARKGEQAQFRADMTVAVPTDLSAPKSAAKPPDIP